MHLLTLLCFLSLQQGPHQVSAVFVNSEGAPLAGLRIVVYLPEGQPVLTTDINGRINFQTWSRRVLFSIAGPKGSNQKPIPLPETWDLTREQQLRIVLSPEILRGGGR